MKPSTKLAIGALPKMGLAGPELTPDLYYPLGRDSFGERLAADELIFDNWAYTEAVMHVYYNASSKIARCNVDIGEVASFDPATVERTELDTLDRAVDSSPLLGSHPVKTLAFEFFIPEDHYQPGGSSSFVIGQVVVTGYGPPIQILYHTSGSLRLRSLISGSFQHTILAATPAEYKGRWVSLVIDGVWSKTTAGQTTVTMDGVQKYQLLNTENVGSTANDANKVYGKVGAYRTAVDTDPARGLGDIWYRNLSWA